jgi:hypothetical protein
MKKNKKKDVLLTSKSIFSGENKNIFIFTFGTFLCTTLFKNFSFYNRKHYNTIKRRKFILFINDKIKKTKIVKIKYSFSRKYFVKIKILIKRFF